jgi:hypothetical protein
MKTILKKHSGKHCPRLRRLVRLYLELLETRDLLSAVFATGGIQLLAQSAVNLTLDQSLDIGTLTAPGSFQLTGTIANEPTGGGDVDWFHFSLPSPTTVTIHPFSQQNGLNSVLSLYNTDFANSPTNPANPDSPFSPPFDPLGHALVAQANVLNTPGAANIQWNLTAGDYYFAVSGAGDNFFHPYIAASGYAGSTGNYRLQISAANLASDPGPYTGVGYQPPFATNGTNIRTGYTTVLDDTPATAQQLGNLTHAGLVQVLGSIGDPSGPDGALPNPAAAVDLYHFQVTGTQPVSLVSEVFAGRIGSTLDPGLSLFEANASQQLQLIASNAGSLNTTIATDALQSIPLFTDPVLFATLTPGNYYLAVSGSGNIPGTDPSLAPGTNGIFDPNVSQSGQNGFTTGFYDLNVAVGPLQASAQVSSVSMQLTLSSQSITPIQAGSVLSAPPAQLLIQFSGPLTQQQLAVLAFDSTLEGTAAPVYFLDQKDGSCVIPSFESYDPVKHQASFLMLDRLQNDPYQLHLAGSLGLAGTDPLNDFVLPFSVQDSGHPANPNLPARTRDLGILFPNDLQAGVTIAGAINPAGTNRADNSDYYQFQILQSQTYQLGFTSSHPNLQLTLNGNLLQTGALPMLDPGTYVLGVVGSPLTKTPYQVQIALVGDPETPPPLTFGPAPVIQLQLLSAVTAPNQPTPHSTSSGPSIQSTSDTGVPAGGSFSATVYQALASKPLSEFALGKNPSATPDAFEQVFVQAPAAPTMPSFVQLALFTPSNELVSMVDDSIGTPSERWVGNLVSLFSASRTWIAAVGDQSARLPAMTPIQEQPVTPDSATVSQGSPALPELLAQNQAHNQTPSYEGVASAQPTLLAAPSSGLDDPGLPVTTGLAWRKVLFLSALAALAAVGAVSRLLLPAGKSAWGQQPRMARRPAPGADDNSAIQG